jgi:hypothetical protein
VHLDSVRTPRKKTWPRIGSGERLDLSNFEPFLREKCATRDVGFEGSDSFFQEPMLSYVARTWEQWLGRLVPDLPPFDIVIEQLRPRIADLIPTSEGVTIARDG